MLHIIDSSLSFRFDRNDWKKKMMMTNKKPLIKMIILQEKLKAYTSYVDFEAFARTF